jgi:hypothetical protein
MSELVFRDVGGWISGPSLSTETAKAEDVEAGDVLLLDDYTCAEVTDNSQCFYWFPDGHGPGVAIGWRSGNSSGLLFRKASDTLHRLPR